VFRYLFFLITPFVAWGGIGYKALWNSGEWHDYPCMAYLSYDVEKNGIHFSYLLAQDFYTGIFFNASEGFYVLNSRYKNSCSRYPVVAFKDENSAKRFSTRYGGDVRDFDFSLYVSGKDLETDRAIIDARNQKEARRAQRLLKMFCSNDLKQCPPLSAEKKKLVENYAYYRLTPTNTIIPMKVPHEAKCPVCGMFVAKYPKWTAKIVTMQGKVYYFDGVKDMLKLYFNAKHYKISLKSTDVRAITVSDYYTLKQLNAKDAYFVLGSNVYGPMGRELIPFETRESAQEFLDTHNGKKIVLFSDMSATILKDIEQ